MKTYSLAPDADDIAEKMLSEHHDDLDGVTVTCLFIYDIESSEAVLKHQGYPAAAVVRITPTRERALGVADATIVVDRTRWASSSARQKNALIDHELTHLERVMEVDDDGQETDEPKCDALGRPKLSMRRHDHQLGWFDEIAERHGEASFEVRQAKQLMSQAGQLYFDFGKQKAA